MKTEDNKHWHMSGEFWFSTICQELQDIYWEACLTEKYEY